MNRLPRDDQGVVCHISSVHPALDERIFYKEARTLAQAGFPVTIVAPSETSGVVQGIRIVPVQKNRRRWGRFIRTNRAAYRLALRQKARIYHFHDPEFLPWAVLLKIKGFRVIYDVHEDVAQQLLSKPWLSYPFRPLISLFFDFFEKAISRKFDFIITATPGIERNFKSHRVSSIRNYPWISDAPRTAHRRFSRQRCRLVYVGGLEEVRGIEEIVRSLKYMDPKFEVTLTLAGRFSEKDFFERLRSLEEWEKVDFQGWIPQSQIFDLLAERDIGLVCLHPLPRFLTALPVKMFEYMAVGMPVIASGFDLWKSIIQDAGCGICVDPLKPREIAAAVEYMMRNPREAVQMGETGRARVLEQYNWRSQGDKLLDIYRKVENRHAR